LHCKARFKSIFCDLNNEALIKLEQNKTCNLFKRGQYIFHEGSYPHGLFCINLGKIKIVQSGEMGKEQILRFAKEGNVIGYGSLLSGEKYSCSAVALEDSSVCFISRSFFLNLVSHDTTLAMRMAVLLANDLKDTEQKMTGLSQKTVRERTAEAILFLKEIFGYETDNITLNISISREEFANLIGAARETATRLLSEFKDDGMVELYGKKIRIVNAHKLIKTANIHD
jgi:CRP/FNR family transcriptional regulator